MSITVTQSATAIGAGITASFHATGGTGPYAFTVTPGGAGGSINGATGVYTAPLILSDDPSNVFDEIRVSDANGEVGTAQILVGSPLLLFCDILQKGLGLENGRVYIWDQKLMQPTDTGLYIAVSESQVKTVGSTNTALEVGGDLTAVQTVVVSATLNIDFISRGASARDRKEELISVLNSPYSRRQQDANSFSIAKLSANATFLNLSQIDGAAIPYRYQVPVRIQYMVTKKAPQEFFDKGFAPTIETDPQYMPFTPSGAKFIDLVWDGETEMEVDISGYFDNARLTALVDIITLDGLDYPSELWGFTRPTSDTIKITAGTPFTGTIRVALMSMEPA